MGTIALAGFLYEARLGGVEPDRQSTDVPSPTCKTVTETKDPVVVGTFHRASTDITAGW